MVLVEKSHALKYRTYSVRKSKYFNIHGIKLYVPQHVDSVREMSASVRSPIFQSHSMIALWHGHGEITGAASYRMRVWELTI